MAQNYICDSCGKHVLPDGAYNMYPKGWYSLRDRERIGERHACSTTCLINLAKVDILHSEPEAEKEVPDGAVSSV